MLRPLVYLLLLVALGCKSQEKGKKAATLTSQEQPELTLLLSDNYGGTEMPDFRVIRDMKSLRQFFVQVNKTRKPGIPVPEIDFEQEMVLLYCTGKTTNASVPGLYLEEDLPDQMVIGLKRESVKQKSGNEALMMPFSLYKVPLNDKEIVLNKE